MPVLGTHFRTVALNLCFSFFFFLSFSSLYFKNPVEKGMKLWLSLPDDAESVAARTALAAASSTPLVAMRAASASVRFHRASTVLAAYDDLPEENAVWQDGQQQAPETEPELVVFRHLSKVGVRQQPIRPPARPGQNARCRRLFARARACVCFCSPSLCRRVQFCPVRPL